MMQRKTASLAHLQQLLLLLGLLVTVAAGKQQCPTAPKPSTSSTKCEVLIIGGGAGGLFTAFMLRDLGNKVCLVEKQPYFGGKLQAFGPDRPVGSSANGSSNPYSVIGLTGMRIDETQPELRCLAQQLGVKAVRSNNTLLLNVKDRWVREDASQLLLPDPKTGNSTFSLAASGSQQPISNEDGEGMYDKLWDYLILAGTNTNPLTDQEGPSPTQNCSRFPSVGTYIASVVGPEALKFLLAATTEKTELVDPLDVCAYMEFARVEAKREGVQYIPQGGFKELLDRTKAQAAAKGVRFFAGSPVVCLYRHTYMYGGAAATNPHKSVYVAVTADGPQYVASRLVFASGPLDVKQLGGNLAVALQRRDELKAIWPVEVAVYNAFYPTRFWDNYGDTMYGNLQVLTTEQCTIFSELPGWAAQRAVNASRPMYASDPTCVRLWKQTLAKGGSTAVRNRVTQSLQAIFPQEKVPQPTLDHFQVLPNAWHHLRTGASALGINSASLVKWASAPLGTEDHSLCLVGEAYYPLYSGWTQGAWASAYSCMENTFKGLLPKASQAANAFINDGCGGAEEFDNEQEMPQGKLPGLSPDGDDGGGDDDNDDDEVTPASPQP